MTEQDARGTTRRALLRNSALGVGALVGGAALVTADATEAGASTSNGAVYLTLDGVTGSTSVHGLHGAIKLRTVSWSLEENFDTLSNHVLSDIHPSLVVLTMAAGRASPALLNRLLNGHSSATGKIEVYRLNIEGVESLSSTITLSHVRVIGFHQKMTTDTRAKHGGGTPGGLVDTVKLTYTSLEFDEENLQATYTVPPPP